MRPRISFFYFIFFIFSLFLSGCRQQATPPNILFIMSDDHAVKAISAYDSSLIQTPHIDKIARDGILFRHDCYLCDDPAGDFR